MNNPILGSNDRKGRKNKHKIRGEHFKTFVDQSETICMILDPNTSDGIPVIVEANKAACDAHGYTRAEFIGRPIADVDDEDGKRKCLERTKQMLNGSPLQIENTHVRKDGTMFPVAVFANRVDLEGEPPLIFTTEHDISERKRSEQALKESEERFRCIFEQVAIGMALIDSNTGRFKRVNQRYCDIVGYTVEEMSAGKTFQEITHPDDLQEDLENMEQLLAGQIREFTMEKRYYHKDGSIVWVALTVSPSMNAEEESPYHIAVVQDITEHKQIEMERETAIKRLEQAHAEIDALKGIIPICSYCREIRNDEGAWERLETYITHHSDAKFSHGICPGCLTKVRAKEGL